MLVRVVNCFPHCALNKRYDRSHKHGVIETVTTSGANDHYDFFGNGFFVHDQGCHTA